MGDSSLISIGVLFVVHCGRRLPLVTLRTDASGRVKLGMRDVRQTEDVSWETKRRKEMRQAERRVIVRTKQLKY